MTGTGGQVEGTTHVRNAVGVDVVGKEPAPLWRTVAVAHRKAVAVGVVAIQKGVGVVAVAVAGRLAVAVEVAAVDGWVGVVTVGSARIRAVLAVSIRIERVELRSAVTHHRAPAIRGKCAPPTTARHHHSLVVEAPWKARGWLGRVAGHTPR